ncbi:hypothetical protein SAMN05444401_1603 [Clostridium amylolyticum]|uniref:Lipoprotein n=1 Tax=Clostridium amylolyticum TaxID=1121298 RepID=A0A1M6EKI3_9CLOT|nr:hypothetical protein [Clostridium amylolyticum]SHI85963.1 hypothetical protein SAMN05444401_1603 [Clostridium amylolyticum]
MKKIVTIMLMLLFISMLLFTACSSSREITEKDKKEATKVFKEYKETEINTEELTLDQVEEKGRKNYDKMMYMVTKEHLESITNQRIPILYPNFAAEKGVSVKVKNIKLNFDDNFKEKFKADYDVEISVDKKGAESKIISEKGIVYFVKDDKKILIETESFMPPSELK